MTEFASLFSALEAPAPATPAAILSTTSWVIAFGAMLCGGQTGAGMEIFGRSKRDLLQSFLKLDNGIPNHDTGSRLPGMLDPAAFQQWFIGFMSWMWPATRIRRGTGRVIERRTWRYCGSWR